MKCPECEFENVDGSAFCRNCGSPLPKTPLRSTTGSLGRTGLGVATGDTSASASSSRSGGGSSASRRGYSGSASGSRRGLYAGAHIGTYEILAEIGRGAMARVWRARDTRLQRDVAIKEPMFDSSLDRATRQELGKRFVAEGRTAARLNHPNIVSIHAAEVLSGTPVIVMELIEGQTLSQLMARGAVAPGTALSILDQLLDAVEYAHVHGVIHRDIKPDNVFMTTTGMVKLGDFGIARVDDGNTTRLTTVGTVMGTPGYMSPEQVLGNPTDARSDLFSIGVIGYELLTGHNPFGADTGVGTATLLHRIAYEPAPQLPDNISGNLPYDLRNGIMAALEKDPEARPQTAKELKGMLHTAPAPVYNYNNYGGQNPPPVPEPKPDNRVKVLAGVVAALVVCLVVVGFFALPKLLNKEKITKTDSETDVEVQEIGKDIDIDDDPTPEPEPEPDPDPVYSEPEPDPDPVYSEPSFSGASCSSHRESYNGINYYADYVLDNNANTAWNEGESGPGIGEWVCIESDGVQYVRGIDIRNGYQKVSTKYPNGELFRYNNRPHNVTIALSDGYTTTVDLFDETGWQQVDFGDVHETTYVKITINSVYSHEMEGEDWDDTCISDLHAYASKENSYW